MSNQDKHCSDCNCFYKLSELVDSMFCPRCLVFSDHVWEALSDHVQEHGAIKLDD